MSLAGCSLFVTNKPIKDWRNVNSDILDSLWAEVKQTKKDYLYKYTAGSRKAYHKFLIIYEDNKKYTIYTYMGGEGVYRTQDTLIPKEKLLYLHTLLKDLVYTNRQKVPHEGFTKFIQRLDNIETKYILWKYSEPMAIEDNVELVQYINKISDATVINFVFSKWERYNP
jgi:hypothetical protein